MASVPVYTKLNLFTPSVRADIPPGTSILDIVNSSNLSDRVKAGCAVFLSDEQPIPRSMWACVKPKPGTAVYIYPAVPEGNDIFRTVAMIAIIAGTALISGGALAGPIGLAFGAEAGALFGASTVGASAAGLGFSVGGSLELNALGD